MPLREIHWEITNQCNRQPRCKYCLPLSGGARVNELTTGEAIVALETFQGAGASLVCFTGGEPFSRQGFLSLLERTVVLGMRAIVITNATLVPKATLETIKELGVELGVSLDGADEITNDVTRGQGSFRQAAEALKQCQNLGISTTLYATVTATNVNQLDTLAKFAREHGCRGIHFNEVTIAGNALNFSDELALSAEQSKRLPELVARLAVNVFGDKPATTDERCWVDGATLYMTADGNLYVCSEVFQRRPELAIGNVRSLSLKAWLEHEAPACAQHEGGCCYGVSTSEHVVFVSNVAPDCAFAPPKQRLETLARLYEALDELYREIELDCKECHNPDCMGYTWLLEEEVRRLYERGVPLVQVNNGPTFIHSFPLTAQGQPDLSVRYPSCSQLCTGGSRRCGIRQDRPLVCHLYPIGLETTTDGMIVWALHRDCLHVRRLEERGLLPEFERRVQGLIGNLSPQLLKEIVATYRAVDAISSFPDGENKYKVISYVKV